MVMYFGQSKSVPDKFSGLLLVFIKFVNILFMVQTQSYTHHVIATDSQCFNDTGQDKGVMLYYIRIWTKSNAMIVVEGMLELY